MSTANKKSNGNESVDFDKLITAKEKADLAAKEAADALKDGAKRRIKECLEGAVAALEKVDFYKRRELMQDTEVSPLLTSLYVKKQNATSAGVTRKRAAKGQTTSWETDKLADELFKVIDDPNIDKDDKRAGKLVARFKTDYTKFGEAIEVLNKAGKLKAREAKSRLPYESAKP